MFQLTQLRRQHLLSCFRDEPPELAESADAIPQVPKDHTFPFPANHFQRVFNWAGFNGFFWDTTSL
jgi:hypothetical protein